MEGSDRIIGEVWNERCGFGHAVSDSYAVSQAKY